MAKNAVLIVDFLKVEYEEGNGIVKAVPEGARQPCLACGWAGARDVRGVSESREPPQVISSLMMK